MKNIINISDIRSKLKLQGLNINDKKLFNEYLHEVNYNLLIGNFSRFFYNEQNNRKYDKDATFSQIVALYNFDNEVAYKLLYYILKIERKLNTLVAYTIINEYQITDRCLFKLNNSILKNVIFKNYVEAVPYCSYDNFIYLLTKYCGTNESTKIYHNKKATSVEKMWRDLPLDIMCLSWSFSTTLNVLLSLDDAIINKIIKNFDPIISTNSSFIDFIKNVIYLRNIISHNYVIFNAEIKHQSNELNNLYESIFKEKTNEIDFLKLIKLIHYFTQDKDLFEWMKTKFNELKINDKFKKRIVTKWMNK